MTGLYVASNTTALGAAIQLQRSMTGLTDVLTRLSTGLRINSGKDDPAGLIASELMKSDITATSMAIQNTQRANNMIAIADSALGQVSNLLNDIRGLVNESANTGAMSSDQIAANQLQVNASLDSIDRISKTTNFQGKLLLDGSLSFTTEGVDRSQVQNLDIQQANFGTMGEIDVKIDIIKAAEPARLYFNQGGVSERTILEVGGVKGSSTFTFQKGASVVDMANAINALSDSLGVTAVVGKDATNGQLMATSAGFDNDINFTAIQAGAAGGAYSIKYSAGTSKETTYQITDPTFDAKGNVVQQGVIEFFLKMEDAGYSQVKALDETFDGIHTVGLGGTAAGDMIVQSENGYNIRTFEVIQTTGAAAPAVDFNPVTGHLKILANSGTANADIAAEINKIDGLRVVQEGTTNLTVPTAHTATTDARPNNTLDITSKIAGDKFEDTDIIFVQGTAVDFNYADSPQNAGVTVINNAAAAAATQVLRLSADKAGSTFNDISFVFEADTTNFDPGKISVTYDAANKKIFVRGQITGTDAATLGDLKRAIEANTPFRMDAYTDDTMGTASDLSQKLDLGTTNAYDGTTVSATIKTGQNAVDMGTDHQALIITTNGTTTTADNIVTAFLADPLSSKFTITNSADSNGSGTIFWNANPATEYSDPPVRIYSGALTGATSGMKTAVTAKELIDYVNNDEVLNKILHADLALNSQNGSGKLTLFDEYAWYGDPNLETGLQFLGPEGSKDIIFSCNNQKNQDLALYFSPDIQGYSSMSIPAKNANAAIKITANNKGPEFDDMVVRYVRRDNNHTEGYVTYTEGPSNAMAYCSINNANEGTAAEVGKFILYSNTQGELHNNVSIVAKLDVNQTEGAKATFDKATNQFIISVNSTTVTLSEAMAAIEADGTFTADYDFSYNHDSGATGPSNSDFSAIFGGGGINTAVIGNTGQTGGHTGGVLEVALAGNDGDTTLSAQTAVDLINNDPVTKNLFAATDYPGSDGTGLISFRDDNLTTVTGGCGKTFTVPSSLSSGGIVEEGYMVIQLATDKYGNSITTARDLVNFFDTLTPEQTRGVSVSLIRPAGQDNLLRTWTTDSCGNVTVSQECDDDFGKGILKPNCETDDCGNTIYHPISFTSWGSNIQNSAAQGDIVSVNGWNSQFRVIAKESGPQFEGTSIVYRKITDSTESVRAEYDQLAKQIVVYTRENTTAAEVKNAIETSAQTKKLFSIELKTEGSALVNLADDALNLQHGTYEAGYRGGAVMLGAADADPHRLTFESTEEGSDQFVTVNVLEGSATIVNDAGKKTNRATGSDTEATLNGNKMVGSGNTVSIYTSMLQLSLTVGKDVKAGDTIEFKITGGGATFQLGPDVTTNQQIRIGLPSVSTSSLGGPSGRLFQLRSDGDAALKVNPKLADQIVQEAISAVATLRGRLGAIQRCTLEPNIAALQDNLEQLSAAEAQITNADFATESSRLSRAQILVQSGVQALGIANQLPQYAASLLG